MSFWVLSNNQQLQHVKHTQQCIIVMKKKEVWCSTKWWSKYTAFKVSIRSTRLESKILEIAHFGL